MSTDPIAELLEKNRVWREAQNTAAPDYFANMADGQSPRYFWIGCCDSRVSLETSTGTSLGEIFVHRNVANLYSDADPAILASLSYAVEVLGIREVVVCGHYGCGGVRAALTSAPTAETTTWLTGLTRFATSQALEDTDADWRRLCELNVLEQVRQIEASPVLARTDAAVRITGLIYDPGTGALSRIEA